MSSLVNPVDFGGVGSGTADDSLAVINAFAALTHGRMLYLPDEKVFRITQAIPALVKNHVQIFGGGKILGDAIPSGQYMVTIGDGVSSIEHVGIQQCYLELKNSPNAGILKIQRARQTDVNNATFIDDGNFDEADAILITHQSFLTVVRHCFINGRFLRAVKVTESGSDRPHNVLIHHNWFARNVTIDNGYGLLVDGAAGGVKSMCNHYQDYEFGIEITAAAADGFTTEDDFYDGNKTAFRTHTGRNTIIKPILTGVYDIGIDINGGDNCTIKDVVRQTTPSGAATDMIRIRSGSVNTRLEIEDAFWDSNVNNEGTDTCFYGQKKAVFQGVTLAQGTGSPEASVTAGVGSVYRKSVADAGPLFFVKRTGSGNTGWDPITGEVLANILHFGAISGGSSSTNKTAIQAAIDSLPAQGGKVYVPRGIYDVNAFLSYIPTATPTDDNSGSITIYGDGPQASVIKGTSLTTAVFKTKDAAERFHYVRFQDLTINNTSAAAAGGIGIDLGNVSNSKLDNVNIRNCQKGIYAIDASYWNQMSQVLIQDCTTGAHLDSGGASPANEWTWLGGKFLGCTTGMLLKDVTNNKVFGTSFENFTTAVDLTTGGGTTKNAGFFNCRMENVPTVGTGFLINSSQENLTIVNTHFVGLTTKISGAHPTTMTLIGEGSWKGGLHTLASGSATPSIERSNTFLTQSPSPNTITNFTTGTSGTSAKWLCIIANDDNTTIQNNSNIVLAGGVNRLLKTGEVILFVNQSGVWKQFVTERRLTGTATWDPASINSGDAATTTVTVTGAALGDVACAGFSVAMPHAKMFLGAHVSATDTVTVVLLNVSGSAQDPGSGTVRAEVFKR